MIERECAGCGEIINPKRLEILPNTRFCVNCSDSGRKKGLTFQYGEGDHSFTDIVIVEEKDYRKIMHKTSQFEKPKVLEEIDYDKEDTQIDQIQSLNLNELPGDIE
jgi:hypothetical protein